MTRLLLSLFLSILAAKGNSLHAQSISDLVTQLFLDTQKLTTLKSTLQEMYTSFELIDKGYSGIKIIAQGNFTLHQAFLAGLMAISPAVRTSPRIAELSRTMLLMVTSCKTAVAEVRSGPFTPEELDYIIQLYSTLFQHTMQTTEELTMVLTADQLRMSDAQRLQALDRIADETNRQWVLLQQLRQSLAIQAMERNRERNNISTLKALYGLPN